MFLQGLDDIDRKILELLSENARMSYVDIGSEVNLSRVAVKSRIQALEHKEIIDGYCVIINPQKISNTVSTFLDLTIEPVSLYEVIEVLTQNEDVTQIYQMTGDTHLHVHTVMPNSDIFEEFLKNVIYKLPGIKKVESNMIISRIKDHKGIRL